MDIRKIKSELGWAPSVSFEDGMAQTIDWYRESESWWSAIKSGEYLEYYERLYGDRLRSAERNS